MAQVEKHEMLSHMSKLLEEVMCVKNKYYEFKNNNRNKVVFVKNGLFYVTYDEDALLVNKVTNYKVLLPNYRLGFPGSKLLQVKDNLIKLNISVLVVDKSDVKEYTAINNRYNEVIINFRNKMDYYKSVDDFIEKLRLKVYANSSLIDKIKGVVSFD